MCARDNYIIRCPRQFEPVGASWRQESQRQTEGFGPSVTHSWATQPRWSAAMVKEELGSNSCLSPSLAHLLHTTNINHFENKVWEIYFYKVCLFVQRSSSLLLTMFPLVFVYRVVVCGYTTMILFLFIFS